VSPGKRNVPKNGYEPRLKRLYRDELRPRLKEELGLKTPMDVPRVEKITLNMGVGDAKTEAKALDNAIDQLTTIAGQRAHVRRARKSIAGFKVREGMPVGARVTLRGDRMYEFLDSIDTMRGLDVAITTSAKTDERALALLRGLGMPFAVSGGEQQ
jgi:large subunit ribosomal protein L5